MSIDPNARVETIAGTPESFGWQRRTDLDQGDSLAWESPTGEVLLAPKRMPPIFVKLKVRNPWIITDDSSSNGRA